jgi:hypothetical protein
LTAILLIAAYSMVAIIQGKALIRKKYWRDLAAFSFFMAFSFLVSLLYSLGVKLPNPVVAIHGFLDWAGLHY